MVGAESGAEALAHFDSGAPVDAMVTDFAMPGMNGLDLIRAAQVRNPELPSFLLTGHVGDIEAAPGKQARKSGSLCCRNRSGRLSSRRLLEEALNSAQLAPGSQAVEQADSCILIRLTYRMRKPCFILDVVDGMPVTMSNF